jgi:hypothetical protein
MALIDCKECGAEISSAAAACPKCGAPVGKAKQSKRGCGGLGCGGGIAVVLVLAAVGALTNKNSGTSPGSSTSSTPATQLQDVCKTTPVQRKAAQGMIQVYGYDCTTVDAMCPYIMSEGYTVYCNNNRYKFELENHGGKWSVKAD